MNRALQLRQEASALEGCERLVTVEISETLAWLVRDLIGIGHLNTRLRMPLMADMHRINSALGYRSSLDFKDDTLPSWSGLAALELVRTDR